MVVVTASLFSYMNFTESLIVCMAPLVTIFSEAYNIVLCRQRYDVNVKYYRKFKNHDLFFNDSSPMLRLFGTLDMPVIKDLLPGYIVTPDHLHLGQFMPGVHFRLDHEGARSPALRIMPEKNCFSFFICVF